MKTEFLDHASFSAVYTFLKDGHDRDILQCFEDLFGTALLFFPALMCKDVALITNIATGATLAGAGIGTIVSRCAKSAFAFFRNKEHGDYRSRYEQIQIAQVMLVYASYFDAISQYLPNENSEISLSSYQKRKISEDGLRVYLERLEKTAQQQLGIHKLLDTEFPFPDQTREFSTYKDSLKKFYEALNEEFFKFFEQTVFWKDLNNNPDEKELENDYWQREYFLEVLSELPENAVEKYEQQYFELAAEFPDFTVWANQREHARLGAQIDVGFQRIGQKLNQLFDASISYQSIASDVLVHYQTKYAKYIMGSIVEHDVSHFMEDTEFPEKREIFIPQAFQAISYHKPMSLEQESTWTEAYSAENIGEHISAILRHPQYGRLPLLILGQPGAGKTLLCHMLAAQILSSEYYVIIIRLRDTNAEDTIMKQISAQIERDLGEGCSWDDIRRAPLDKPVLLIFDGYDELLQASGKTYSDYLNKIAAFQADEQAIRGLIVRCLVTSRITLVDKASIPRNSQLLRLCDFDDMRIQLWCNIWNEKNAQYFSDNGLNKFEIASAGNLRELARQPLLLMMIALYEMNGGHLQERQDINRAELYYQLIQDFIVRENAKRAEFNQLDFNSKRMIVQKDFHYLAIAALGMYNRKKLFIQTKELNKDIAFLTQTELSTEDINEYVLPKGDQLVGRFFFVHSSTSTIQRGGEFVKTSAYEFLHNTFGEFLTAYYILDTLFRLIRRQKVESDQGEMFSWPEAWKKEWYVGLSYAPLFSRPEMLDIVHELSVVFMQNYNLTAENVETALNVMFCGEVRRIISGEGLTTLNNILHMQGNPYKHPELMIHAAVYSVNLILLRSTVCTDGFTFTQTLGSENDWRKLSYIWRYAFSEEELVSLSCLVKIQDADPSYTLSYVHDESAIGQAGILSKLNKLQRISDVLGNSVDYAIFNSFGGCITPQVRSTLDKEHLKLKTRYALNDVSRCLASSTLFKRNVVHNSLITLCRSSAEEHDVLGMFVYFALLRSLSEAAMLYGEDMQQLLSGDIFQCIDDVLIDFEQSSKFVLYNIFFKETIVCSRFLPFSAQWGFFEEFSNHFRQRARYYSRYTKRENHSVDGVISLFLLELKSFLEKCQSHLQKRPTEGSCYMLFRNMGESYPIFNSWQSVPQILQICRILKDIGCKEDCDKILDFCFQEISPNHFIVNLPKSMESNLILTSSIIEYCYYTRWDSASNPWEDKGFQYLLEALLRRIGSIKNFLPTYDESLYHLLCILCDEKTEIQSSSLYLSSQELQQTIRQCGKQMSLRTLKQIAAYGNKVGYQFLHGDIEKLGIG